MQRILGLPDPAIVAYEERIEAAVRAALQSVADRIADRIASIQVASARMPAMAMAMIAADTPPADSVPPGDGLPPGQPYVSPDELASVTPMWQSVVEQQLLPIVAQIFMDAAGQTRANMVDATTIRTLPSVGSLAAEQYLAQARATFDMIGQDLWETSRSELLDGFERGESIPQLADRIRGSAGISARTSVLVARTQVIEASNAGSYQTAVVSGIEMRKVWIATPDLRTRPTHLAADAATNEHPVPLTDNFVVGGYPAMFPAAPSLPPAERYNCFPGDTPVLTGQVRRIYRHWFDGELVEVTDGEGRQLTGTPNHPVLTDRGWVGLAELVETDKLITYRLNQDAVASHNIDARPTLIGEMFDALASVGTSVRISGFAVDFHGDRPQGDVDVVAVDGELWHGVQSDVDQSIEDFLLPSSDEGSRLLSTDCGSGERLGATPSATNRIVSGLGESRSLFGGRASHPREQRRAAATAFDPAPAQEVGEGGSLDATFDSQRLLGLAGEIALDEIVSINRIPWSGHVFNLETSTGAYVAGYTNTVVHNCRCTIGYVMSDDAVAKAREAAIPEAPLPGTSGAEVEAVAPKAAAPGEIPPIPEGLVGQQGASSIRPALRQTTPADLSRAWQAEMKRVTGRDIIVQIPPGASMATMGQYAEATVAMLERFPEMRLRKISWFDADGPHYARVRRGTATLEFNARWASEQNRRAYLSGLRNDVKGWTEPAGRGWSVRGASTPQATAYHELGHMLSIETFGGRLDSKALSIVHRRAVLEGIADDELVARDISAYAGSNAEEMIAEAFTDVVLNGPAASQISRELYEMITDEYRRAGLALRTAPVAEHADELTAQWVESLKAGKFPPLAEDFDRRLTQAASGDEAVALSRVRPSSVHQREALDAYGGEGPTSYSTINDGLRGGQTYGVTELNDEQRAIIRQLDDVMRESPGVPRDLIVYRATGAEAFGEDLSALGDLTGRQWTDPAFVSTGASEAWRDTSGISMRILVPRGTKGISYTEKVARGGAEAVAGPGGGLDFDEILLDRDLTFRVVADHGFRRPGNPFSGRDIDVEIVQIFPKAAAPRALSSQTVAQLRALAKERGIAIPAGARKADLVKALEAPAAPPISEGAAIRAAARERNRLIESSTSTGRLLAKVDELVASKATKAVIRQELDPALLEAEQLYAGADLAIVDSLRAALDTGDPAKLRAALTRAGTKSKIKPVGKAGGKAVFDPETMEGVGGITIEPGTPVTIVRRGSTLTLPDKTTMQIGRAQVTPVQPKVVAAPKPRIAKARAGSTIGDVERGPTQLQVALGEFDVVKRPPGDFIDRAYAGPAGLVAHRGERLPEAFRSDLADIRRGQFKLRPGLTAEESDALDQYVLSRVADPLNTALRRGQTAGFGTAEIAGKTYDLDEIAQRLDSAIAAGRLTEDATLYRGALMRPVDVGKLQVGAITREDGFLSTTSDRLHAFEIIHWREGKPTGGRSPVLFEILAPKGTNGAVSGVQEAEVLLARGRRMRVLDVSRPTRPGDVRRVTVELLPDETPSIPLGAKVVKAAPASRLATMKVADLRALAKEHGIVIPAGARKADLVKALSGPGPEAAALTRQADIDAARAVGDLGAEVLELVDNGASARALRARIEASAKRLQTPDAVRDALLAQVDDASALRAAVGEQLGQAGVDTVGTAGKIVRFDRKTMDPIGGVKEGDWVVVDRPGTTLNREGEAIQLAKAKVSKASATEAVQARAEAEAAVRDTYPARLAQTRKAAASKATAEPQHLGGGQTGTVTLVERSDGTVVEKVYGQRYQMKPAEIKATVDAEVLGAPVVDAVGVRSAATIRLSSDRIASEYLEGQAGAELFPFHGYNVEINPAFQALIDSDDGRLMGIADYLMYNIDRNEGNWVKMAGDRLGSFDLGSSFQLPEFRSPIKVPAGDFTEWLQDPTTRELTATVDIDPRDLAIIRARLEALRPQFTEASRSTWFNTMMRRLGELEKRAVGTRQRITP